MELLLILVSPFIRLQTTDFMEENELFQCAVLAIIFALGTFIFGMTLHFGSVGWLDATWAGLTFSAMWFAGRISILLSSYVLAGLFVLAGDRLLEAISAAGLTETITLQSWLSLQSYGWLVITLVLLYYCSFGLVASIFYLVASIRKAFK